MIVEEQNWQPMIDEIWNNRQPDDYTGKNMQKRDYMRAWTHSRTIPILSLEEIKENGTSISGDALFEIADPSAMSKRIEKMAGRFESFVSKEYGEFLDKHIE